MARYTHAVDQPRGDPPIAEVVSFADRARALEGGGTSEERGDASAPEPADLALEAMYSRLGQLARGGPGPAARSVDDELAVLVYDSATESEPLAGIRGDVAGMTRQLTFSGPGLVIEVQLEGPNRELTCQLVPSQPASLEVRHSEGSADLGDDAFGTFHTPGLPCGAISLRCVPLTGDSGPISTSWITVSDRPIG